MYYKISRITEEDGWIAIDADGYDAESIIILAQAYAQKIGGTLVKPYEDDAQFIVKGDSYRLVFQYDDMFGNIVILNDLADKDKVVEILEGLFAELKERK